MSVLIVENLCKSFGSVHVTQDVSLSVGQGECHALIGPNGAGKTTLIHQISGVLKPDSGHIRFDGHNVTALPVWRRVQVGLSRTFQITSIIPSFSVLENVALAVQAKQGTSLRFIKPASAESALNAAAMLSINQIGLSERAVTPAKDLSHGERRLLELGIALAGKPKFLLLDEPMAGLGRVESEVLTDILLDLRRDIPMLLVEHDMDAIFRLADVVSVLVDGVIIARGTPGEVRADPTARAAYLGGGPE